MKRLVIIVSLFILLTTGLGTASAERLELGVALTPTFIQDEHYEAFSDDDLNAFRIGADVRVVAANFGGFKLIPFLSYRFAEDGGEPYYLIETDLKTHDFSAGLRVSKSLTTFMAVYGEVSGGLLLADMKGSLMSRYYDGYFDSGSSRDEYQDLQWTWMAGGMAGLEFFIPEKWLEKRGVRKFGFGMEIAFGYTASGDIDFEPKLKEKDEYQIDTRTFPWGSVNMSGFTTQIAATFKFF